jgi:hypothetical protein
MHISACSSYEATARFTSVCCVFFFREMNHKGERAHEIKLSNVLLFCERQTTLDERVSRKDYIQFWECTWIACAREWEKLKKYFPITFFFEGEKKSEWFACDAKLPLSILSVYYYLSIILRLACIHDKREWVSNVKMLVYCLLFLHD